MSMDKAEQLLKTIQDMLATRKRVEEQLTIANKEMELALLKKDWPLVEEKRVIMLDTFSAGIDAAIETHKIMDRIEKEMLGD